MTSLKIYSGETPDREKWGALAEKSLISSPDFVSIWQSDKIRPIFFTLEEDGRILAGMAGVQSGGRLMPRFESMIDGLAGGVHAIDDNPEIKLGLLKRALDYFRENRYFRATIHNQESNLDMPGFKISTHTTHILNISDPAINRDPKIDEHIRTGERRGAQIVAFDNPDWLDSFQKLILQTADRHGTVPRYEPIVFERLFELSKKEKRIIWIAALYENRLIGSRISFVLSDRIINWQSFSDKEHGNLKANYLMMDYIIKRASELGIKKIDLGGSPREADGLIDFKRRWGGQETDMTSYTYYSALGALYFRWKNR